MRSLCVLVACLLSAVLAAQTPPQRAGTALVLGQVVDADTGKGVSGAIVTLGAPPPPQVSLGELVELSSAPVPTGRRVLATADGRFVFRDLPKGRYALSVTAPGYVIGAFGQGRFGGPSQTIDLADAEKLGSVAVPVWKFGAISGTVLDERGEPAVGTGFRCLRRVIAGGQPRFTPQGSFQATTDDRGMYRVGQLIPGEYVCGTPATQTTVPVSVIEASDAATASGNPNASDAYRAMQASGGRADSLGFRVGDTVVRTGALGGRVTGPPPAADGRVMTYPIQYVGGASTTTQASVITLKSGEERSGVDLQLKLVPAARVSGTVVGPGGPGAFLGITLIPASGSEIVSEGTAEAARTVSDANGRFTFLGIPSGQYVIRIRMYPRAPAMGPAPSNTVDGAPVAAVELGLASAAGSATMGRAGAPPPPPPTDPSLWSNTPISVGSADLTNIAVTLRAGVAVSGRVEFTGSRTPPTADQIQRMTIRMQSAEGRTSSPIPAEGRAAPDGTFRTASYAGGQYIASVLSSTIPPGWTLRSITWSGRDISTDPVDLTSTEVTGVVITFTDQTTELSGTVTNGRNAPDARTDVVIFPADSQAWKTIGVVARRWRDEHVTKTGTFTISGLPPGDYFVAAVADNAGQDTRDPKFLDTLTRTATRVSLGDGEKKAVNLKSGR